jgi:hypothetical protein
MQTSKGVIHFRVRVISECSAILVRNSEEQESFGDLGLGGILLKCEI